jgi:multidrug resistance efflux pump
VSTSGTQAGSQATPETVSAATGGLAYLDQALWKRFHEAATSEEFAGAWLALQCSMLPGIRAGVVVLCRGGNGPFAPAASWPDGRASSPALAAAAESALGARKGVVNRAADAAYAAYPIEIDGRLYGVAAIDLGAVADGELRKLMRQLQWGCGWLEANLRRTGLIATADASGDAALAVELAALGLEARRFQEAATAVVTELAMRLDCDRVGLGVRSGRHCRVAALSHNAQFGESSNLTRAIAAAMDEAIDQFGPLAYPQHEGRGLKVDRAHAELAKLTGSSHVCTVPLADRGELFGALTFDGSSTPLSGDTQRKTLERLAAFLGPVLAAKHREDRWVGRKVYESGIAQLERLLGPGYAGRKAAAVALGAVIAFFAFATDTYRVQAMATLEGSIQRAAVAPIAGYILEANVRAGDVVKEGDQLFRIDDRDLRLEFLRLSSQKAQVERQQRDAFAQHERSEVNVLRAQLDQAESQLSLVAEQIARTRGVAPFDGVVVSGDLSDQLGAPVERGQILFTIAPLDQYRVALQVPETEISEVKVGQAGQLALAANPNQVLPIEIKTITPVSNAMAGRNTFRVEASLGETPEFLRPGMQGAARIEVDKRKLGWIWTHDFVQWAQLRLWSWWP